MMRYLILTVFILALQSQAWALNTEIGINYNYKKSAFDAENNTEQQSATGSLSFYFWERVALELSYTNGLYVKKEKQPVVSSVMRTTTQYSDIYGGDLIFVLSDRKAAVQPYLKGGVAYVKIKQVVQDDGANPWELVYSGYSPSYGVGFKFFLTESFALRASYDGIQTPTNDGTKVNDYTGRVGVSWMF
jgi:opacity protein-like surface antigen